MMAKMEPERWFYLCWCIKCNDWIYKRFQMVSLQFMIAVLFIDASSFCFKFPIEMRARGCVFVRIFTVINIPNISEFISFSIINPLNQQHSCNWVLKCANIITHMRSYFSFVRLFEYYFPIKYILQTISFYEQSHSMRTVHSQYPGENMCSTGK